MFRLFSRSVLLSLSLVLAIPPADAGDAASLFDEAVELEQAGDFEQAINRFAGARNKAKREANPSLAAECLLHMSDCYRGLGNTLEFRRHAEDVLRRHPGEDAACARALLRVGEDCWLSGHGGAAQDILSRIARQYPEDTNAIALARMQTIQMDLAGGAVENALAEAESLLVGAAGSEDWYDDALHYRDQARVTLAAGKVRDGESRAQGISELESIAADPGAAPIPRAWANYHLSQAAYWDRDYAGSIAAAEAALSAEGIEGEASLKAWSSLQLAISQIALGDVDAAYETIIACDRDHGEFADGGFQNRLAYRFREIVDARRAAGDLPPEPADPDPALAEEAKSQTEAAFALVYTGDATGAISLLQSVITDYASQPGAVGWARYRLAEAYYQNRDYPNTIATAESLLADYSPAEYPLLCGWTEVMLAAGQLATAEANAALATLERCRRAYALLEDEGYQKALGARLHEAKEAARSAQPDQRAAQLAVVNNRWLPRSMQRQALAEYAHLCASEGDTLAALRAQIRLRQHYGDGAATLEKANEYLEQILGRGNVPRQVAILRQAQEATDDVSEKEIIQEEIAYRYLAGGYIDEATEACREAIRRFGREANRSFRLAVTQGDAYMKAKKRVRAWSAYLRAVPVPFVHSKTADRLARKLGYLHRCNWGADSALQFYDSLHLPEDDAKIFAWKCRAYIGSKYSVREIIPDIEARLATAGPDAEQRLPLYWALLRCQMWVDDFPAVEATIQEMRDVIGDDREVDRMLMDIVLACLGPRGEMLCTNIINESSCEFMRQAATFEMGWCKRNRQDWEGALAWYEQAASMECPPGEECIYPWMGHLAAGGMYLGKGKQFFPWAQSHFQEALLLAQECYPKGVAESYVKLGGVRELEGDLEAAAILYQEAIQAADGENQNEMWDEARVRLGRVRMRQGDTAAAGEILEEAIEAGFHRNKVEWAQRLLEKVQSNH